MKKRILVVDDDQTSLKLVESTLASEGYDVKTAAHAEDIEQKAKDYNPNLIVMDLMMPKVDGSQAVKRLQTQPTLKNIPVVFLTAMQTRDDDRGFELQIQVDKTTYRTLSKPFDRTQLLKEIESLIK